MPDASGLLIFALISLLAATIAVVLTSYLLPDRAGRAARPRNGTVSDVTRRYEFRDGYLLSEIDANDAFLDVQSDRSHALELLEHSLVCLHPEVRPRIDALRERGQPFILLGALGDDPFSLTGRLEDDRLVISVGPADPNAQRQVIDASALRDLQNEVTEGRRAMDQSRLLVWKETESGRIVWANAIYFDLVARATANRKTPAEIGWPIPRLFPLRDAETSEEGVRYRVQLGIEADPADPQQELWFELSERRDADGCRLFVGQPVDRLIAAEQNLKGFVQTLSKTFAQLPVGLAVFDRNRDLVLFNPALVTLSTLEPAFLSARPALKDFLDRLRDAQRMPEPKDYKSWRDEIARLEAGAEDGSYHEIWALPSGESLRVTGRPHPDGAVAFVFEDISAELTLTRQFRAELEHLKAALDTLPEPLAIYGTNEEEVFANAAYRSFFPGQERTLDLHSALAHWDGTGAPDSRPAFAVDPRPLSGGAMLVRVSHDPGGAPALDTKPAQKLRTLSQGEPDHKPGSVGRIS